VASQSCKQSTSLKDATYKIQLIYSINPKKGGNDDEANVAPLHEGFTQIQVVVLSIDVQGAIHLETS
jgi:hypothetical protein